MFTSFAAGTLIVLGALLTVLGFLLAGLMAWVAVGLIAIFGGGVLGAVDRRVTR
jgi:hypothetical protein